MNLIYNWVFPSITHPHFLLNSHVRDLAAATLGIYKSTLHKEWSCPWPCCCDTGHLLGDNPCACHGHVLMQFELPLFPCAIWIHTFTFFTGMLVVIQTLGNHAPSTNSGHWVRRSKSCLMKVPLVLQQLVQQARRCATLRDCIYYGHLWFNCNAFFNDMHRENFHLRMCSRLQTHF